MDKDEIILNHRLDEGKKAGDVIGLIYEMFNTYQISQSLSCYILTRILHEIHLEIDEDIQDFLDKENNEINEEDEINL